jgi:hypothetical protein
MLVYWYLAPTKAVNPGHTRWSMDHRITTSLAENPVHIHFLSCKHRVNLQSSWPLFGNLKQYPKIPTAISFKCEQFCQVITGCTARHFTARLLQNNGFTMVKFCHYPLEGSKTCVWLTDNIVQFAPLGHRSDGWCLSSRLQASDSTAPPL